MSKQIAFYDRRMIAVMEHFVSIGEYSSNRQFFKAIGYNDRNFIQIKNGRVSFTVVHFHNAVEMFGIDGNYFLNEKHTKMFKSGRVKPVWTELTEVVARLKIELKKG